MQTLRTKESFAFGFDSEELKVAGALRVTFLKILRKRKATASLSEGHRLVLITGRGVAPPCLFVFHSNEKMHTAVVIDLDPEVDTNVFLGNFSENF